MFDIAWSELALIGAVALIVIGPKDLPKVMRTAGQWTRKARLLAGEFQHGMDEMMRQAELEELRKQVQSVNPAAVKFGEAVENAVKSVTDPISDLSKKAAETEVASPTSAPAPEVMPSEVAAVSPKEGAPVAAAPEGKGQ